MTRNGGLHGSSKMTICRIILGICFVLLNATFFTDSAASASSRLFRQTTCIPEIGTGAPYKKLSNVYDYTGRRIQKTVSEFNGSTWTQKYSLHFLYDRWSLVAEVSASNGPILRSYAWGADLSGGEAAGGIGGLTFIRYHLEEKTLTVAADAQGNTASLYDLADGTQVAIYEYGPFGEPLRASGPFAEVNPFRFSTKYEDPETGWLYYGYRFYSPTTGRWASRDPIGEAGGVNLYGFVGNDGVNWVDPLGDSPIFGPIYPSRPTMVEHESGGGGGGPRDSFEAIGIATLQDSSSVNILFAGQTSMLIMRTALRSPCLPQSIAANSRVRDRVLANIAASQQARAGSGFALASRRWTALDAYESTGWPAARIESHLHGIDFSKPVRMTIIPAGTPLVQYQIPGSPLGNYFAPLGTHGNTLGFYTGGRVPAVHTFNHDIRALQSTAADITDTWSVPSWSINAPGGGTQFFVP